MKGLSLAGASLVGDRPGNEDRFAWWRGEAGVLLAVGDGLGGHRGGAMAAERLMREAGRAFQEAQLPLADPLGFLQRLLAKTHEALLLAGLAQDPPGTPMTTAALALVQEHRVWWATLGDSRVYWVRGGEVLQLSRDHSYAEELLIQGLIQEPLPADHPWRARLTRCLGGFPTVPPPHCGGPFELAEGDVLALCSDGLWGPLGEAPLADLRSARDLQEAVEGLVRAAVTAAAPNADNTTLVAVRRGGSAALGV